MLKCQGSGFINRLNAKSVFIEYFICESSDQWYKFSAWTVYIILDVYKMIIYQEHNHCNSFKIMKKIIRFWIEQIVFSLL